MANNYFSFKQFTVFHDKCAMKVGTDGVMLGAWADVERTGRIIDAGTGTGLIAIMLAQRTVTAVIDAVEIDEKACGQALENVRACPWSQRINVHNDSFQHFAENTDTRYDLVVSNPPFFRNALKPPVDARANARHDTKLSHDSLLFHAATILNNEGRLAMIVPAEAFTRLTEQAYLHGLYISKLLKVRPLPDKPVSRCLVEFCLNRQVRCEESMLTIRGKDLVTYTDDYKALTNDFYL